MVGKLAYLAIHLFNSCIGFSIRCELHKAHLLGSARMVIEHSTGGNGAEGLHGTSFRFLTKRVGFMTYSYKQISAEEVHAEGFQA